MSPDRHSKALDVALDNVTPVLEFAESALYLVPVPGLSLVAKGLSVILDRVKDARANDGTRRAFLDKVKALDNTLMKMVTKTRDAVDDAGGDEHTRKALVYGIAHSDELQLRVQTLLGTIMELRELTKDLKGGPGALGFFKGFIHSSRNEATLSDMKDRLASAIQIFKLQGLMTIENVLGGVIKAQKEAEENNVLDSIVRASAGYRCVDELKGEFLDNTRQELFEELALWSTGDIPRDITKQFYFLSGVAGLGKSSIAHQLCTRLDQSSEPAPGAPALGASFFFVRAGGELESTRLFFSSLAHQLAQSQPTLRSHIITAARQYLRRGDRQQMKHAFKELLQEPLAGASIVTQKPVVIVIDGLDECKERELVPDLLQYLLELVRALPWVRVFVASRPEPHILSVLTSADTAPIVYHRSLEDTLVKWGDDVRYYLKETVSKIPPYGAFVRNNPDFLERLIKRAGGVFIFARLAVRFLDTYRDHPNPQEQFELLFSSGGVGLSPLDALYLQILLLAFPPKDIPASSSGYARLRLFLTIIALQRRPLTPETMALFELGLPKDDIVWMTDRLRSALLIDNQGCVVPLHATFGEFLLDPERCINPLYQVNPSKGHARLASACIAALTFENVTGYLTAENDAPQRRYLNYARFEWASHLPEAEFDDGLNQQLMYLIGAQMAVNARISVAGVNYWSLGVAATIEKWLKGSKDAAEISVEWTKSVVYSRVWWTRTLDSPNLRTDAGVALPNIIVDDITSMIMTEPNFPGTRVLDFTVRSSDIARYQAVHEELVKQIFDAGLPEVWFDPNLGYLAGEGKL
ncbi:AAA-16 domain-containing protein [Mycena venus]|uniref:AAA-16 domain-containing protein n=1 Tax=Mycena venus TaxID=2733690 RepID=A0A8H6YI40_9AGAR|nr:AAA-16 domain-containing protein [Mycena venus]